MTYSKITQLQFNEMQFGAGVWVRDFDITAPAIQDTDIICATTGGIGLSVQPSIVDLGDSVYMMPKETAEMLIVTGWTVDAEFTALGFGSDVISFVLGAADTEDSITPRNELKSTDFHSLWWIGDRVDGGLVAARLLNALSDEGIEIQTERQRAGQITVHLTAHASLEDDKDAVPVEIYSIEGRPFFDIVQNQFLAHYNTEDDGFAVDEETGQLIITEQGGWHYTVNAETGRMEIERT